MAQQEDWEQGLSQAPQQEDWEKDLTAAPKAATPAQPSGGVAGKPNTFTDALMGLGQGSSLGLGPYINAGIDTAYNYVRGKGSTDYNQNVDIYKRANQMAQENSPIAYKGSELVGGTAAAVAGGAGATGALRAAGLGPTAAGVVGSTASNVAQAGARGAATAAPNEDPWEAAKKDMLLAGGLSVLGSGAAVAAKMLTPSATATTVSNMLKSAESSGAGSAERDALIDYVKKNAPSLLTSDTPTYTGARAAAREILKNEVNNSAAATVARVADTGVGAAAGGYGAYRAGASPEKVVEAALAGGYGGSRIPPSVMRQAGTMGPALSSAATGAGGVMVEPDQQQGLAGTIARFKKDWLGD